MKLSKIILTFLFLVVSCSQKKEKVDKPQTLVKELNILPGNYIADVEATKLTWVGRKISSGHDGTIDLKDGSLNIGDDGQINGKFNIDMSSISVSDLQGGGKKSLERHLKNEDFFDVNNFPIATLEFSSRTENIIKNKLSLASELTVKNITNPLKFSAQIIEASPQLKIKADIVFDRSIYDVRYGSGKFFENLGDRLILDEVQIGAILLFNL